jgi:hypothetical protein
MQLLTKEIRDRLSKLYACEKKKPQDVEIIVKFFTPWSNWTWYAYEGEPVLDEAGEEVDFTFFGYVKGLDNEFGYFSLQELQSIKGAFGLKIERDLHFKGTMQEVLDGEV